VHAAPEGGPSPELRVAGDAATRVDFDEPLGAVELPGAEGRVHLARVDEDTLVLVPNAPLAEGERLTLTVTLRSGPPLRFTLLSREGEVDTSVRVVRHPPRPEDEEAALATTRHLLDMPGGQPVLATPQDVGKRVAPHTRARAESLLRVGPRLFVTLALRNEQPGLPLWRPSQTRLRATLAGGDTVEWGVPFFSNAEERGRSLRQPLVLTALLPEGAVRLEVPLDSEETLGAFHSLPLEQAEVRP
jgi:hypothetical protein